MVSSLLADAVADPTAVLLDLFAANDDIQAFSARVAAHFSAVFSSDAALAEIPALDALDARHDRALVRFRAMVQDTSPSPEIYRARWPGPRCGGWGLADASPHDISYDDLRESTVFWAVSVPAQSPWCADPSSAPHNTPHSHKFPVPHHPHHAVQVKVYHNYPVKPTELHTFVGILTSEPLHADLDLDSPALVPTLHVLFSLPTPTTIVPRVYPDPAFTKNTRDELITWIADASLAGDQDAAEWVLLAAIARVQSRSPPILPLTLTVSCFPSPSPTATSTSTPALSHILTQIFPLVTTLPLSLSTLNTTSFAPESKNEDLHSGWLQLPRGTVCVVTEGGVSEGNVSERGLNNLRATQEMMNAQTLQYVFPYSAFAFDTDVAFVILSEGTKSAFFHASANIPLRPAIPDFDFYKTPEGVAPKAEDALASFRALVGAAKIGSVTVNDQTAQFIQEDFVQERKAAPAQDEVLTQDHLIQRMMIARLLALSMQEPEITVPIWKKAKEMETTRRARILSQ
ncbi:hypothetical protein DXG03_007215 [Asterophora parasitica]|uniref:Mini-chromosome maintenance complex-binding protein n=1 Tax=Asterophora parasitica TaxID=117018 RepID=A0A9P7G889_9AGAR|nr:hypothetical protein DXG03_007215 [Asterophora parasitica]